MTLSLQILLILGVLGVAQAALLAVALLRTKRGNLVSNRLLSVFAATIGLSIAGACLTKLHYSPALYNPGKIHQPISFLGAPLLFLYVKSLWSEKPFFRKTELVHFVPALLCAAYLVPFYSSLGSVNHDVLVGKYYSKTWFTVRVFALLVQLCIYLVLIITGFANYKRGNSVNENVTAKIRFLFLTFSVLWVIGLVHYVLSIVSKTYFQISQTDLIVPVCLTGIIYAIAYLGLREPGTLTVTNLEARSVNRKYTKSALTAERAEDYVQRLFSVMENERPYTDGKLTLAKLAKRLSISSHHLSQILNDRVQQNFFDFVNSYRIEEAKRKLIEPATQHYSILGIAEEVGFNSKSAFNNAFKKHTNMTPTEFKNATNNNSASHR
jgi:AraC-like DNA-binding protein